MSGLPGNIPLPFPIPPIIIPNVGNIPLPSNFVSITPSTANIPYPMPELPITPSTAGFGYPMPNIFEEPPSIPAEPMMEPPGASSAPLQKLIASFTNEDFTFQSKYRVDFSIPGAVFDQAPASGLGNEDLQNMSLHCDDAVLPGVMLDLRPYRIYGPSYSRPAHVSYGDTVTLSIMLKQDYRPRRIFEAWLNIINDPISYNFKYPATYLSSGIVINQVKHRGADVGVDDIDTVSIRLIDAFPVAIEAAPLSYGSHEIQRIRVTFSYRKWISAYEAAEPQMVFEGASDYIDAGGEGGGDSTGSSDPTAPPEVPEEF